MSKHIYQVETRIHREDGDCTDLSEFYSSRKKAEEQLRLLCTLYDTPKADRHEADPHRDDQVSPTIFFNARHEPNNAKFRAIRILKVEVL